MKWLKELPYEVREGDVHYCHGSPLNIEEFDYIFARDQAAQCLEIWDDLAPLTLIGHSHLCKSFALSPDGVHEVVSDKFELRPGWKYIVSVGSVGQPRDYDPRASYALFDTDKKDVRVQARRLRHQGVGREDLQRRPGAELRPPAVHRRVSVRRRATLACAVMLAAAGGAAAPRTGRPRPGAPEHDVHRGRRRRRRRPVTPAGSDRRSPRGRPSSSRAASSPTSRRTATTRRPRGGATRARCARPSCSPTEARKPKGLYTRGAARPTCRPATSWCALAGAGACGKMAVVAGQVGRAVDDPGDDEARRIQGGRRPGQPELSSTGKTLRPEVLRTACSVKKRQHARATCASWNGPRPPGADDRGAAAAGRAARGAAPWTRRCTSWSTRRGR